MTPTIAACLGMSFWKRARIAEFLGGGRAPAFCRTAEAAVAEAARRGGGVAVWATREPDDLAPRAAGAGVPVVRVEDGFIRSVGLGADFLPGASIILDARGIYYDPRQSSDLEAILAETRFTPDLLARAARLRDMIVERGLTKYNVGRTAPLHLDAGGRRSLFVPGQVEDDMSVRLAGAGVAGNLDLLARVRTANPDAYIVYKPHPDVDAGHRAGRTTDTDVLRIADRLVRGVSSDRLIAATDETHTLTSLAGFEALLRDRPVTVHGQPFYAGWGLTDDLAPIPRRTRRLSLDELVAGALILYARYVDPATGRPCEPETLIDRLGQPQYWRAGPLVRLRRLHGALGAFLRIPTS